MIYLDDENTQAAPAGGDQAAAPQTPSEETAAPAGGDQAA